MKVAIKEPIRKLVYPSFDIPTSFQPSIRTLFQCTHSLSSRQSHPYFMHLSVFIHSPVHPLTRPSVRVYTGTPTYKWTIAPPIHAVHPSTPIDPSTRLFIHPFILTSIDTHPCIHRFASVHYPVRPSCHPPICTHNRSSVHQPARSLLYYLIHSFM